MAFLLALFAGWLAGPASWAQIVEDVRVRANGVQIRFDPAAEQAGAFLLAAPQRVALDVQREPWGRREAIAAGSEGGPGGGVRVVLDLSRPAIRSEGAFGADGRTLTLQLRTTDDARFARAVVEGRVQSLPPFSYLGPTVRSTYRETIAIPPPRPAPKLPTIYGTDESRPLVVIDAGHGGHDPGAVSPDGAHQEKDITLEVAQAIRNQLLESGRVRVALTRENDRFLVLQERYGIARRLGADLFISVHCDSAGTEDASGATVYTLSEVASDREAARLAARENRADVIADVDLGSQDPAISSILIDLAQRETMNVSARFARLLGREAEPLIPTRPNFHRMASLIVLKAPDMPSVLFEAGYISNEENARFLASDEGQRRVAQSVQRAVEIHFATRLASR